MIIMLAGPIKHWWDENWDTPEHWHYVAWRDQVGEALVKSGYLVYRPHEAFKGAWDERAQSVNDMVLRISDVILNLTPPGVPSLGTDGEVKYAANYGKLIIPAPPTANFDQGIEDLLSLLANIEKDVATTQEEVVATLALPGNEWMLKAFLDHFKDKTLRFHFLSVDGGVSVQDTKPGSAVPCKEKNILKIEALASNSSK
jgi:hypothetical protein